MQRCAGSVGCDACDKWESRDEEMQPLWLYIRNLSSPCTSYGILKKTAHSTFLADAIYACNLLGQYFKEKKRERRVLLTATPATFLFLSALGT